MNRPSPLVGIPLLLLLGSIWGGTFSLAKFAIGEGVPVVAYGFWQTLAAGIFLFALISLRGERLPLSGKIVRFYFVSGFLNITAPNLVLYTVLQHLPAGLTAVVVPTAPMFTFLLALLLAMERFNLVRALGVAIGFAGTLMLVLPRGNLPTPDSLGWLLLAFITPTCYAIANIYAARKRPANLPALPSAAGMLIANAVMLGIIMLVADQAYLPRFPPAPRDFAVLLQGVASASAYMIFYRLLFSAGPVYASQVAYVVTLMGMIWGMIFFGESHSLWIYGAAVTIFAGVALVNLGGAKKAAG